MSYVGTELRRLRGEVVRLNRRLAMAQLSGPVAERDAAKGRVRLELGEDPDTGAKILSPWVRVQSNSAGALKSFALPSVGEQMSLHSASGVIGADSVARFGTFTDQNPAPTHEADEAVLAERGETRIAFKDGQIVLKTGAVSLTVSAAGPAFAGGKLTHENRNIGSDHKHGGVVVGGSDTSTPH